MHVDEISIDSGGNYFARFESHTEKGVGEILAGENKTQRTPEVREFRFLWVVKG